MFSLSPSCCECRLMDIWCSLTTLAATNLIFSWKWPLSCWNFSTVHLMVLSDAGLCWLEMSHKHFTLDFYFHKLIQQFKHLKNIWHSLTTLIECMNEYNFFTKVETDLKVVWLPRNPIKLLEIEYILVDIWMLTQTTTQDYYFQLQTP